MHGGPPDRIGPMLTGDESRGTSVLLDACCTGPAIARAALSVRAAGLRPQPTIAISTQIVMRRVVETMPVRSIVRRIRRYSDRSDSTGSMRVARRAGTSAEKNATANKTSATAAKIGALYSSSSKMNACSHPAVCLVR